MVQIYDVSDKRILKKLTNNKRFIKYPDMFLSKTCRVRVNPDEYLRADEFIIQGNTLLPRTIYLYGKRTADVLQESCLYLNYWMPVFLKTIENGNLCKSDFNKSSSKLELTIGLPLKYRYEAFNYSSWKRNDVIEFLSCLFNNELYEVNFQQQDIFDEWQNVA